MRNLQFQLNAPSSQNVALMTDALNWRGLPLTKGSNGIWTTQLALAAGSYGYKFLVDGAWLLDPANANQKVQFGIPNSAAVMPQLGEIWIALREDGEPGSGAPWDPLNASVTDVGQLLLNISEYTTIHLGPSTQSSDGAYLTNGILLHKGCKLIGAGREVTVIRLISATPSNIASWTQAYQQGARIGYTASFISCYNDGTDCLVADLTIDCNGDGLAAKYNSQYLSTGGVGLTGDNCTVRNVRVIHVHGNFSSGQESFPLYIDNDCKPFCRNGLIENCLIDQYCSNSYGGSISIFDNRRANTQNWVDGSTNMSDSTIRDCVVKDNLNGTACFGACGDRLTIEDCQAIGSAMFFYYDTALSRDLTIRGCRAFVGNGYGPSINGVAGFILMNLTGGGMIENLVVADNDVVLYSNPPPLNVPVDSFARAFDDVSHPGRSKNWKFKNNHVGWDSRSTASSYYKYALAYIDRLTMIANTQDKVGTVDTTGCTNVTNLDP